MSTFQRFLQKEQHFSFEASSSTTNRRIGLVQLATDYTLENEWRTHLPDDIELYTSRFYTTGHVTIEHLLAMQDGIGSAAELLVPGWELDVLAFGCTSASLLIGDPKVHVALTHQRPSKPSTNPWRSSMEALKALGAKRVAMLTPYTSKVNFPLYQGITNEGLDVVSFGAFQVEEDPEIPPIPRESIMSASKNICIGADALFISCTNLRVMGLIEELEQDLGIPVVTSNQAMLWHALRLAGDCRPIYRLGRLFRQ
ncbi:aspartate/glutamate racemase family protein [Parasalinivibrio latis]|uniref:maleate cis-trans isomerase family protein n=1 Tax=Parasalinivibrio latis TaxID=2952610 RepID=UPI0030E411EB